AAGGGGGAAVTGAPPDGTGLGRAILPAPPDSAGFAGTTPPDGPLRLLVVDDQAVVRLGFTALLDSQDDMSVVGSAGDGQQAVRLAARLNPDVVLIEIRRPVLGGIEPPGIITRGAPANAP